MTLISTSQVEEDLGSFNPDLTESPECLHCGDAADEPVKNVDFNSEPWMIFCSHTCEENYHTLEQVFNRNVKSVGV